MERLLQRFIPGIANHLTDDRIVGLFSRELPFLQRLIARRHLAQCQQCRVRQADLEGPRVDQVMRDFHDAIETRQLVLPAAPRSGICSMVEGSHAAAGSVAAPAFSFLEHFVP